MKIFVYRGLKENLQGLNITPLDINSLQECLEMARQHHPQENQQKQFK